MLKLNPNRTYRYPVTVTLYDEQGKEQPGRFTATFRVLPHSQMERPDLADQKLLDLVLVSVEDVEVPGPDGHPLAGDALMGALKDDPSVSTALVNAYQESVVKKNLARSSSR